MKEMLDCSGRRKLIPRSSVSGCAPSIQQDLIYASQNSISSPAQKEEQQEAALALLEKFLFMLIACMIQLQIPDVLINTEITI
jgi:hypothetical protein